jgi:hypothetical protein
MNPYRRKTMKPILTSLTLLTALLLAPLVALRSVGFAP